MGGATLDRTISAPPRNLVAAAFAAYHRQVVLARREEPEIFASSPSPERGRRLVVGVATAVVAIAAVVAVPLLLDGDDDPATVRAGPASAIPMVGTVAPTPNSVELQLEPGWQTLLADGDKLVVGTRPLVQRDLLLSVLARDDVAFSAFPAEGAVLVVGGDRLKAKYVGNPSQATRTTTANGAEIVQMGPDAMVGPGPPLALGPEKPMPGGVTARLGEVPRSSRTLAAYFGPSAPDVLTQQAEAMAATVRLQPTDPATIPPPPPGSRPGFDSGSPPASSHLRPVASYALAGTTYTARAEGDCADVVISSSAQPLAGGCSPGRPAESAVHVVAVTFSGGSPPSPPPGQTFAPERVLCPRR